MKRMVLRIESLRSGSEPGVDLRRLPHNEQPGDVPLPDERAVLELASLLQRSEDPGHSVVTWDRQVRAQRVLNLRGLCCVLDEIARLANSLDE